MKNVTVSFLCCLCCIAFLASCGPKPEQALIGKWQEVNGREAIEFVKGGTFHGNLIWDLTKASLDVNGTYIVKGDLVNLTIEKPGNLTPMTWKVKFSGSDELTMTFQQGGAVKLDGGSASFRRVK